VPAAAHTEHAEDRSALAVARDYVRFIETADREGIAQSLADHVEQVFPIGSEPTGEPAGRFVGKQEVLDYTYDLFRKFSGLHWLNPDWTESSDGKRAFLEARGDAIVVHSGVHCSNVYIVRFDVEDGLIVRIKEYANGLLYVSLGIEPSPVELKAVERVQQESKSK
jgi:ketosteroid isomerase-like protein